MKDTGNSINGDIYFQQNCFTITLKFRFRLIASVPWRISGQFSEIKLGTTWLQCKTINKTYVPFVVERKGLFHSKTHEKILNRWKKIAYSLRQNCFEIKLIFGNLYTRQYLPGIYSRTGYITGSRSGMFLKISHI